MKTYQTKTGVKLTVIQGGGQGDGVPRGILVLVPSMPELEALQKKIKRNRKRA